MINKTMRHNNKRVLPIFEGPDGSGKSTLIKQITEYTKNNYDTKNKVKIIQPAREPEIEFIHNIPTNNTSSTLLFLASFEICLEKIENCIKNNEFVFIDRWTPSTLAYQYFIHSDENKDELIFKTITSWQKKFIDKLRNLGVEPVIIYIYQNPEELEKRKNMKGRIKDKHGFETDSSNLLKAYEQSLNIIEKDCKIKVGRILSDDKVFEKVKDILFFNKNSFDVDNICKKGIKEYAE